MLMSKTNFVDGDPSQGILGTVVTADYLNTLNNHYHTGLDQDGHGALPYAVASGSNDLSVTLNPPLTQYVSGMPIYLKTVSANGGPMTLSVDGLESKPIFKNTSEALTAGEVPSGAVITVVYDGTAFQLQSTPVKFNADTVDTKHAADLLARANHTGTQTIATLSDHDKAAHDALGIVAGSCSGNAATATTATKTTDGVNVIYTKIINIGDWNMDASATPVAYPVPLGVSGAKIRSVSVHIIGDMDEMNAYEIENLLITFVGGTASIAGAYAVTAQTNGIYLLRVTGGYFDNAQHDKTSYNRGWVTITYVD